MSKIEWTDKTWNVITGCTQISPACDNCYAKAMTKRLQGMARKQLEKSTSFKCQKCGFDFVGHDEVEDCIEENDDVFCVGDCGSLDAHKPFKLPKYYQGWNKVVFHEESLRDILDKKKYPKGSKVFVNSMSDTFHEKVMEYDINHLFEYVLDRQDLIFQFLTKRPKEMFNYFYDFLDSMEIENELDVNFYNYLKVDMYKHVWFGVTAENQKYADKRIPELLKLKDIIHDDLKCFVSIEPMLGEIDLTPYLKSDKRLDWVIVGGEKIPNNPNKARLMQVDWVKSIYQQCKQYHVPFFFKQWGSTTLGFVNSFPFDNMIKVIESCKEFPK